MPTLKSAKSLCYRVLRGAPLTPRTRYRSPSSSPKPFSILVTELFHRDYSALFIRFVSQPRSPQPSSVHVFSSVLRPRLLNHSPSSSPEPSSIPVTVAVLYPRHRNRSPFSVLRSSFPKPSSILVSVTIFHPRPRNCPSSSSPEPFSIPVHRTISPELFRPVHQIRLAAPFTSTVLRPCFQLCSPDSPPIPVLHPSFF